MGGVLVTHADLPLGRRIVKLLWHDPATPRIVALGEGPAPRAFDSFRIGTEPRLIYERLDHARQRSVAELFRSRRLRELEIHSVVYVPRHGASPEGPPVIARVPTRTAEARLILHQALEHRGIRTLVALGSALVYKLAPGNANHLFEDSPLDLDPAVPAVLRTWIDSDMLFQAEASGRRLRVALLRLPTVVASGGFVYLHPLLEGAAGPRLRPAGFDPLCPVIADKDVAHAVMTALASRAAGVFHVAGRELVPLSVLGRWTGRALLPLPGPLLRATTRGAARLGLGESFDGPLLRFGMSLDTRRAAAELGFTPRYRIGLVRAGDGALRLEAVTA
jgi:nucleoside-diphosphate-sugar epimerase